MPSAALASRLKTRGYDVRVVASGKSFRVRIGRYVTRAEAVAAQGRLKAKKITSTIAEIGSEDR